MGEPGGERRPCPAGWTSTEFVLIRHGQTTWNAAGIIQGQADAPLDGTGAVQARALADALASGTYGAVSVIASSDLSRAADTAFIIADALGVPKEAVIMTPDLRERHMGRLQGVTRHDAAAKEPQAWHAFLRGRHDDAFRVPGGGESYDDVWDRAVGFVERMAQEATDRTSTGADGGERIALVTHGGTLHTLRDRCDRDLPFFGSDGGSNAARRPGKSGVVHNCSVNTIRVYTPPTESRDEARWEVVAWGDTSHLTGAAKGLAGGFGGTRDSA